MTPCGSNITNEVDCPLFELTRVIFVARSTTVLKAVSMIHECTASCKFSNKQIARNVEREQISTSRIEYEHDFKNILYCLNLYCMSSSSNISCFFFFVL